MSESRRLLLTLTLALATFMQVLDTSIANVSIPAISLDLASPQNQGVWVITAFAASNGISMLLTGWLARRFGEAPLFAAAILLFVAASVLCGLAPSIELLVVARVVQGLVSGPLIPLSQSLLLRHHPPERKARALALWSGTAVIAPILGPVVGGWITDHFGWPWIFFINAPVGLVVIAGIWQLLPRDQPEQARPAFDVLGLVLLIVSVIAIQLAFDHNSGMAWQALALLSLSATAAFAWRMNRRSNPIVDLRLFADRNFLVGTICLALGYLNFFAHGVIVPLWLQNNMHYSATWAGLASAPVGIASLLVSPFLAPYMRKETLRIWASIALMLLGVAAYLMSFLHVTSERDTILLLRLFQGVGLALLYVPLTSIALGTLRPAAIAGASGLMTFTRYIGASLGVSLYIGLWEDLTAGHLATMGQMPPGAATPDVAATLAFNELCLGSAGAFIILIPLLWLATEAPRHTSTPR